MIIWVVLSLCAVSAFEGFKQEDGHAEADCPFLTPEQYAQTKRTADPLFSLELTDENFLSLTKTPATDTSWFILFYRQSEEARLAGLKLWDEIAIELEGDASIRLGQVDVEANPVLETAFAIRKQKNPVLLFLHQQSYWEYRGPRTKEQVITFAISGFQDLYGSVKEKPFPPSLAQNVASH